MSFMMIGAVKKLEYKVGAYEVSKKIVQNGQNEEAQPPCPLWAIFLLPHF